MIDAFLQVLATDPTRALILFVGATSVGAFAVSGTLAVLAAVERRLAVIFRRRPRPLPLHGPVRPFMRKVLESRDAQVAETPVARPRPFRLLLAIVVVVAIVVTTGYRMVVLVPSSLSDFAQPRVTPVPTPITVVPIPRVPPAP